MKNLSLSALPLFALTAACGASQPSETGGAATAPAAGPAAVATPGSADPAADGTGAAAANPAPDFTLPDLDGNTVSLSSMRGKIVVLEWFNPGCPFVRYAHGDGPLRDLAAKHTSTGVVWLAINSGSKGKQGYGVDLNREWREKWHMEYPVLLDEKGEVGRSYGATNTPQMFVIDARGSLVYRGALDNAPLGKVPSEGHRIYLNDALAAVAAGRPVEVAETKAYGCSVKYAE
ncbi:MAG TPA: thioredoxin family protein [Kofleriaceae bacterium]|jgi:peroxiredoxin